MSKDVVSVYLAGSIQKGHEPNESEWTEEHMAALRKSIAPARINFLNPATRKDDLSDSKSVFGRDMTQVFLADIVIVDARHRRGLGVGAEMMWAKVNQKAVITWAPQDTHYHKKETSLLGQSVDDYMHPFVFALSDYTFETLEDAARWIQSYLAGKTPPPKPITYMHECMQHYHASQYTADTPMQELIAECSHLTERFKNAFSQELNELDQVLDFISLCEALKREERHCWLVNGRRESVAEHAWRLSLMAFLLNPYLTTPVDLERVFKLIAVHDLVEIKTGDIPSFVEVQDKTAREMVAMQHLKSRLPAPLGHELYQLWLEYEMGATDEARFAKALDKIESDISHYESDIATWIEEEQSMRFYHMDPYCTFDPAMQRLKDLVKKRCIVKLAKAGIDVKKAFKKAQGESPHASWPDLDDAEDHS